MTQAKPIDLEIEEATAYCRKMLDVYVDFDGKYKVGESYNTMYGDILDFVNFRMETAKSCLILAEQGLVADALGLCRSLLENYLLLKLICRGTKYFQLQNFEQLSEGNFKVKLGEIQAEVAAQRVAGETECLDVRAYPRAKRHVMYVFDGLKDSDDPTFKIPIHYFHFAEFQPETMRLKNENYFTYYESADGLKKARKAHMQEQVFRYRHYLSYDALIECLELNGLSDKAVQARIDAHYTFLGRFLHPTHQAARMLHVRNNHHSGGSHIGMDQTYAKEAVLLALMYVCHLLADILDEVAGLFEAAPARNISEPGTSDLRAAATVGRRRFPYFWFLYNDPSLYDKFMYAIHHVSDEDLEKYGSYGGVPDALIPFNQEIYAQLRSSLGRWSNVRVGVYASPLSRGDSESGVVIAATSDAIV